MHYKEKGEWDFKPGKLPSLSIREKVRIVLVLLSGTFHVPVWALQQYFQAGEKNKLRAHLIIQFSLYIFNKLTIDELRMLVPLRPLRLELNQKPLVDYGKNFHNYNKIFHVNDASARWIYEVKDRKPEDPVILYLHGGAYFLGTAPMQIGWLLRAVPRLKSLRMSVLEVDYTVSPHARYPQQLHESIAVYQELSKTCERIVLLGDSAGGNLSMACLDYIHERGLNVPFGLVLISPWINLRGRQSGSYLENKKFDYIDIKPHIPELFCTEDQLQDPRVNPIVGDADYWRPKLPAHSVCVWGGREILRDDCRDFATTCGIEHCMEDPRGLHDTMIASINNKASTYVLDQIKSWFGYPERDAPPKPKL